MALSFNDWMTQIASDYVKGGYVTGTPTDTPNASVVQQLVGKMNNQTPALQALFAKGITPEQVLYGQSGQQPNQGPQWIEASGAMIQAPNPGNDPTVANNAWLFNPNKLSNPNLLNYDPSRGVTSPQSNLKQGGWDKFGAILPYAIMTALLTGGAGLIGQAGGYGTLFKTGQLGQTAGNLFSSNTGGVPGGGAPATTAQPNNSGLLALLSLLGLLKGR